MVVFLILGEAWVVASGFFCMPVCGDSIGTAGEDFLAYRSGWVSELIAIAGGEDVFAELARRPGAADRILADPLEAVRRAPDILIGSWCGKRFRPERVVVRSGWQSVPAVRDAELHEIKSALILSPGPVAIREGLPALAQIVARWAARQSAS